MRGSATAAPRRSRQLLRFRRDEAKTPAVLSLSARPSDRARRSTSKHRRSVQCGSTPCARSRRPPEFPDMMARIDTRFEAPVITEAGDGNFDDQLHLWRPRKILGTGPEGCPRQNGEIRLHEDIIRKLKRVFNGQRRRFRQRASNGQVQCVLDQIMRMSFRRHHDDVAPDQLEFFVLAQHSSVDHSANVADIECTTRKSFSGSGDVRYSS